MGKLKDSLIDSCPLCHGTGLTAQANGPDDFQNVACQCDRGQELEARMEDMQINHKLNK